jgi:hypothetical protein
MINLNELNPFQLVEHIEREVQKYHEQKALHSNHSLAVYGGVSGKDLQTYTKALDRALYTMPTALETKSKVDAILQADFSIGMLRPVGKIKSLYEIEQEKNQMAMNKFHDVKKINRNPFNI